MEPHPFAPFARAQSAFWQRLLRQSICLYLALGSPGAAVRELEAALRTVEGQMVWHLLQDEEPTPDAAANAWAIVEMAQGDLLEHPPLPDTPRSAEECLEQVVEPA